MAKEAKKEDIILTPHESSFKQREIFDGSQAEFRNLHKEMVTAIEATQEENGRKGQGSLSTSGVGKNKDG